MNTNDLKLRNDIAQYYLARKRIVKHHRMAVKAALIILVAIVLLFISRPF